jgi:pyridoxine 5'-phosphate synthase PdxJ
MSKLNICNSCGKKLSMKEVRIGMGLCVQCLEIAIPQAIKEYQEALEKARMN